MLRAPTSAQIPIRLIAGLTTAGATTAGSYSYYHSEQGNGLRRQTHFWSRILPIVLDYYLRTSRSSPYFKYIRDESTHTTKLARTEYLTALHEKHAPTVLRAMLDLKGLYIKLGQVLSVTALPVPEAYRVRFRTLQSDVPTDEEFDRSIRPVIEEELGRPIGEVFRRFDPVPCGAASIGQAHRATLRVPYSPNGEWTGEESPTEDREVVVKVQYPNARWQVPADIRCVGLLLRICVLFNVLDESAATLSYDEFSRQFLSELDYNRERRNLEEVRASSLDPTAPYLRLGVIVPEVYGDMCGERVVTMGYLPGPKFEGEAKRQLELLGVDTKKGVADVVREAAREAGKVVAEGSAEGNSVTSPPPASWRRWGSEMVGRAIGVDTTLWFVRSYRRIVLWRTISTVNVVRTLSFASTYLNGESMAPERWEEWAETHRSAARQAQRLKLTESWIHALFDVHGHQIFCLGLFNADPHPGNILVIEEDEEELALQHEQQQTMTDTNSAVNGTTGKMNIHPNAQLGLIDYGQCKRLTPQEQVSVANLVLTVADDATDDEIATAFRNLGVRTANDSSEFLATFARLMFGRLKPEHLSHSWHARLHAMDRILYFPNELSMVYRTSLLLRGLGMALQVNCSVGEEWREHARAAIDRDRDSGS